MKEKQQPNRRWGDTGREHGRLREVLGGQLTTVERKQKRKGGTLGRREDSSRIEREEKRGCEAEEEIKGAK